MRATTSKCFVQRQIRTKRRLIVPYSVQTDSLVGTLENCKLWANLLPRPLGFNLFENSNAKLCKRFLPYREQSSAVISFKYAGRALRSVITSTQLPIRMLTSSDGATERPKSQFALR